MDYLSIEGRNETFHLFRHPGSYARRTAGRQCAAGMSGLRLIGDHHDRKDSGQLQLLAMHELWRGLERRSSSDVPAALETVMAVTRRQLISELQELIAALDRRVPQVERAGELSIARDAAALRAKALKRIAKLEVEERESGAPGRS